jgi:hypothetical protein
MRHHSKEDRMLNRLTMTAGAALAAAAIVPAGAMATTSWFGSSLDHSPANAGSSCGSSGSSAPPPNCTHVGSFYPGFSGRTKARANGTITKVRLRAEGAMTLRFEVVRVKNLSSSHKRGKVKMLVQGPTIHVPGAGNSDSSPVQAFKVHVKVKKGDELAITTNNNQAEYCSDGTPGQLTFFSPVLKIGQGFRQNSGVDGCLLLVQAVIKKS